MRYLDFFGLAQDPFRLTPDRQFFFPSRGHAALREVIRYGLESGEGFVIISGEVGTGKTLMLRLMMDDLSERFETALILSPHLLRHELLLAILRDLDLPVPDGDNSLDALLRILNDHLSQLAEQGRRLLVIIDEAQNLPDESLEQLRLLSNFETDTQKLLQIVLFGQPELRAKLRRSAFRQFLQRVTIMETLPPLSKDEMLRYVRHRLQAAGIEDLPLSFGAVRQLWRLTRGYPRMINKVMSRALLVAYGERKRSISPKIFREAAASFNLDDRKRLILRQLFRLVLCVLVFFAVSGVLLFIPTPALLEGPVGIVSDFLAGQGIDMPALRRIDPKKILPFLP